MSQAQTLLRWFDRHGRRLPWRGTRDPYKILVSEIMLQQTQVPRVILYYKNWLKRFPNWDVLARATSVDVIHAWSGLGYNRRALVLRDIARTVTASAVPQTKEAWLAFKGIGPYTAAALAAFSLHKKVLPIDTNIRRVGGRLWLSVPFLQPEHDDRLRRTVLPMLKKISRSFDIPQALFDLASSHCVKTPDCKTCPMKKTCLTAPKFLAGTVRIPKRTIKKAYESHHRNKPHPDRIYRGRILKLVRETKRAVSIKNVGPHIDPLFDVRRDHDWLIAMINRLIKDGLLEQNGQSLCLPRETTTTT